MPQEICLPVYLMSYFIWLYVNHSNLMMLFILAIRSEPAAAYFVFKKVFCIPQ
jgi:hypothetical protein